MAPGLLLGLAVGLAAAGPAARLAGLHLSPFVECVLYGLAVVGAAAVLAWATEVAQLDVSRAVAFSVLALIAVLPEYAVDMYFAYTAATHPEYASYAAANMTGANRLLVGIGWPLVALLAMAARRRGAAPHGGDQSPGSTLPVRLPSETRLDNGILLLATLYSFLLPFKASISLFDMVVLVGLFAFYAWRVAQAERGEPEMLGPAALIVRLPRAQRRLATVALFAVAGVSIFLVAEPFAEALIETGSVLGIDRFLLVQWLAPLASEAPELAVVSLLTLRGYAGLALAALLASRLNQWTLLVGMLPLAYSVGAGGAVGPAARRPPERGGPAYRSAVPPGVRGADGPPGDGGRCALVVRPLCRAVRHPGPPAGGHRRILGASDRVAGPEPARAGGLSPVGPAAGPAVGGPAPPGVTARGVLFP